MKILISRTDNLGDVMLSLPVAGKLRQLFPEATLAFVGKKYTKPLIDACTFVDEFIDKDHLENHDCQDADAIVFLYPDIEVARWAKAQHIRLRIGTSHRWWHWLYCNQLITFSRKRSTLHEAQLNFKLLAPLGFAETVSLSEIPALYGMKTQPDALPGFLKDKLQNDRKKVILHPKSKGSAREWSLDNYYQTALRLTDKDTDIFITGSQAEGQLIVSQKPELLNLPSGY